MNQITLTQEDLQKLDAFIQELPVKYGLPLIQFLNELSKEKDSSEEEVEE